MFVDKKIENNREKFTPRYNFLELMKLLLLLTVNIIILHNKENFKLLSTAKC